MKIVKIEAKDWAQYNASLEIITNFQLSFAKIVGFLIKEDDEKIVLSHQWFPREEGITDDVRYTTVIPKKMIKKIKILEDE